MDTLNSIKTVLGNRKIALARELTKIHEEFKYGLIEDVINTLGEPKGEFVIIVEGNLKTEDTFIEKLNSGNLEDHFNFYKNLGYSKKDIIKMIAKDRNVPKNEIYQHFLSK